MLHWLNQNKAPIGYVIAGVTGAVWGIAQATGAGAVVEPYVGKVLIFAGGLIAAGKTLSDREARQR